MLSAKKSLALDDLSRKHGEMIIQKKRENVIQDVAGGDNSLKNARPREEMSRRTCVRSESLPAECYH
jgi:hypothetical protein